MRSLAANRARIRIVNLRRRHRPALPLKLWGDMQWRGLRCEKVNPRRRAACEKEIAVAIAEQGKAEFNSIRNDPKPHGINPTGYVQLTTLGVECQVVAPTLVPVKAGDR